MTKLLSAIKLPKFFQIKKKNWWPTWIRYHFFSTWLAHLFHQCILVRNNFHYALLHVSEHCSHIVLPCPALLLILLFIWNALLTIYWVPETRCYLSPQPHRPTPVITDNRPDIRWTVTAFTVGWPANVCESVMAHWVWLCASLQVIGENLWGDCISIRCCRQSRSLFQFSVSWSASFLLTTFAERQ